MKETKSKKLICFVIPVFNEEENIPLCYAEMKKFAASLPQYDFEFLFTNNHSNDRSLEVIKTLRQGDPRVKFLSYSKNFGYQQSILKGLLKAKGDAAVILDCDLQDPLEVVTKFITHWEEGYHVVYGVRISRVESKFMTALRRLSYHLINKLSEDNIPIDAGDFRLVDQKIIHELRKITEDRPHLRTIIASLGFDQTGVPYERLGRQLGTTKFPLKDMIRLTLDGMMSRSNFPPRIAAYVGVFITFLSAIGVLFYFIGHFFMGKSWPQGYASLMLMIIFGIGINALFLGILGEYINRIYILVKKTDQSAIIQEAEGIDS